SRTHRIKQTVAAGEQYLIGAVNRTPRRGGKLAKDDFFSKRIARPDHFAGSSVRRDKRWHVGVSEVVFVDSMAGDTINQFADNDWRRRLLGDVVGVAFENPQMLGHIDHPNRMPGIQFDA